MLDQSLYSKRAYLAASAESLGARTVHRSRLPGVGNGHSSKAPYCCAQHAGIACFDFHDLCRAFFSLSSLWPSLSMLVVGADDTRDAFDNAIHATLMSPLSPTEENSIWQFLQLHLQAGPILAQTRNPRVSLPVCMTAHTFGLVDWRQAVLCCVWFASTHDSTRKRNRQFIRHLDHQ